jgi:hypothetical protein
MGATAPLKLSRKGGLRRFGVALVTLTAGCSLFESGFWFRDSTGISEAGAPDSDASAADVMADVGFCASHPGHQLCADFDEADAAYNAQFGSTQVTDSGSLGANSNASVSAPNSLLSQVAQTQSGIADIDTAYMNRTFSGTTASIFKVEFDLRLDRLGNVGQAMIIAALGFVTNQSHFHYVLVSVGNENGATGYMGAEEFFDLPDGGRQQFVHDVTIGPQLIGWTHVLLTLNVSQAQPNLGITLQTSMADAGATAEVPLVSSWTSGSPSVTIGIGGASSESSPWAARYDNVTVDFQ